MTNAELLIDLRTFFWTFFDKAFSNNCIRIANFSTKLRFDNNTSCLKTFTTHRITLAPITIFAVHWKRNSVQQVFNNNFRTKFVKWVIADRWYGMNQTIQNKFSESFGQHRINLLRLLTTAFDNGMLIKLELLLRSRLVTIFKATFFLPTNL